MDQIREWLTALTCACFVSGLVRLLVGEKSRTTVINLVAVLYILLSVFQSGTNSVSDLAAVPFSDAVQTEAYPDAQQLTVDRASALLETQFAQECDKRGIDAHLEIRLTEQDGEYEPAELCIFTDENSSEAALELAQSWFGTDLEVTVKTEEQENE